MRMQWTVKYRPIVSGRRTPCAQQYNSNEHFSLFFRSFFGFCCQKLGRIDSLFISSFDRQRVRWWNGDACAWGNAWVENRVCTLHAAHIRTMDGASRQWTDLSAADEIDRSFALMKSAAVNVSFIMRSINQSHLPAKRPFRPTNQMNGDEDDDGAVAPTASTAFEWEWMVNVHRCFVLEFFRLRAFEYEGLRQSNTQW